jgi:IS30 family transposase
LPQRGRKRRRYGRKRAKKQGWTRYVRSIEERTEHGWEGDTVKGKGRERLLTHVHESLYLAADLIPNGTADAVRSAVKENPLLHGQSITYDRGSEFALWQLIERDTNATVYFASAHAPWERPKNENTNGRLRRPFPKRFDLGTISKDDLADVVDLMNHTPRKSLSWRTPCAVFKKGCCNSD